MTTKAVVKMLAKYLDERERDDLCSAKKNRVKGGEREESI